MSVNPYGDTQIRPLLYWIFHGGESEF
jgi:hypothetical protein